jgi:acetolactate decarboxylase
MIHKHHCFEALISFLFIIGLYSCQSQAEQHQQAAVADSKGDPLFYHYSIWYAFVNRVFEGDLTVSKLKQNGDIGLGSYNRLDGELIMLDGTPYQVKEDGVVNIAADTTKVVYANASFFNEDQALSLRKVISFDSLRSWLNEQLPTKNYFYAFKVHGTFKNLKCGGLHKQDRPFTKGLDVLIPARPVYEREEVTGTMVGFYCPEFIGQINVAGYHLHFISDDKKYGGHVMEFGEGNNLAVAISKITRYQFELPQTAEYEKVSMDKTFQYNKK